MHADSLNRMNDNNFVILFLFQYRGFFKRTMQLYTRKKKNDKRKESADNPLLLLMSTTIAFNRIVCAIKMLCLFKEYFLLN